MVHEYGEEDLGGVGVKNPHPTPRFRLELFYPRIDLSIVKCSDMVTSFQHQAASGRHIPTPIQQPIVTNFYHDLFILPVSSNFSVCEVQRKRLQEGFYPFEISEESLSKHFNSLFYFKYFHFKR